MSLVRKVTKNTAKNPVARAVAVQRLRQAVTTQRIAVFMMEDGEDCRGTTVELALPVFAVMTCFDAMKEDSADSRRLKSGCAVLSQLAQSGFIWRKTYAITLDNALEICERRWITIKPELLNSALSQLESSE